MFTEITPSTRVHILPTSMENNLKPTLVYHKCIRYPLLTTVIGLTVSVIFNYTFPGINIILIILSIILIILNCYICMKE